MFSYRIASLDPLFRKSYSLLGRQISHPGRPDVAVQMRCIEMTRSARSAAGPDRRLIREIRPEAANNSDSAARRAERRRLNEPKGHNGKEGVRRRRCAAAWQATSGGAPPGLKRAAAFANNMNVLYNLMIAPRVAPPSLHPPELASLELRPPSLRPPSLHPPNLRLKSCTPYSTIAPGLAAPRFRPSHRLYARRQIYFRCH